MYGIPVRLHHHGAVVRLGVDDPPDAERLVQVRGAVVAQRRPDDTAAGSQVSAANFEECIVKRRSQY